ncbi:SH3 domain-containing protein [Aquibium sp. ELW1220]|uniref:SH3 domain-containing protein n=1 Tax=Aquibium sp. ELW1220 TaxID=2976766 RepID=UPI0025B21E5D|nr:SH3 domain-containing protein [Aquibium sp. ELW1220]MDN2583908.1 SH3 domain-containing protein [Aquibium sp. ELW1220]
MLKKTIVILALLTAWTTVASASSVAVSTANVNLRAGPAVSYPVVTVVPQGARIVTHGCVADYAWCDVALGNYRGWVSASYIHVVYNGVPVVLSAAVAPAVGVTVVAYDRVYWDTYYVAQPWYGSWTAYYRPYAPASPRVTSQSRSATCADGNCTGTRAATGIHGGATSQTRNCAGGECSATRETTGRYGNSASRVRSCSAGDRSCDMTRTGPRGGTATGTRSFSR